MLELVASQGHGSGYLMRREHAEAPQQLLHAACRCGNREPILVFPGVDRETLPVLLVDHQPLLHAINLELAVDAHLELASDFQVAEED